MTRRRYVDEAAAIKAVERIAGEEAAGRFKEWLRRQRKSPRLISARRAAEVLGVLPPHIARLRQQGRMPEVVPIEGGNGEGAYVLEDVEALARVLKREREERQRRKEQRDGAGTEAA